MRILVTIAAALVLAGCTPEAPSPQPSSPAPIPAIEVPEGPAPTTAGNLDESRFAVPEGWEPVTRDGSVDEGYLGNGSWVHAVDPVLRGSGTLSVGCSQTPPELSGIVPIAALEGTVERDGAPGILLALEFEDVSTSSSYFDEYLRQLELCVGTSVEKVRSDGSSWEGRRDLGETWSEAAVLNGEVALFAILGADLDDEALALLSSGLREG